MTSFIGRKKDLEILKNVIGVRSARLIIVKGRRRIGKTRLLQEFSRLFAKVFTFSGLPPEKDTTDESQRKEFAEQLIRQTGNHSVEFDDWSKLFWQLSEYAKTDRVLIILDEISWLGSMSPVFLGKLKNAWDLYFKKNDQLVLALSGSISSWIEKNILSSTGFLGRVSLDMTLNELPLSDCMKFWDIGGKGVSIYEKLKILAVTGGVPRYLEEIKPELTAEENIKNLCFAKEGILYKEFENIFSDLFSTHSNFYKRIVTVLADGSAEQISISEQLGIKHGGIMSGYLDNLVKAGFISRDYSWQIKDGKTSKLSKYRLKDNYSRFYLKYILPNKEKIESGWVIESLAANLPQWDTIMGLQLENLVLNNKDLIRSALKVSPADIVCDNPFFQRKTLRQKGCQIDYLIQTKLNALYVCEIKFSRNEVRPTIIDEMREKISRMQLPKNFSYWPVLIHINGVHEQVENGDYFAKIINFAELASNDN
ncbi:MAG: AAA family ATPase [Gammaproteobacteria bacterium]|nr:AAA family ATPase [Gammaproteobacteria bacterium]